MQYCTLGKTDMVVSREAFGCWGIVGGFNWGPQDEKDSVAALRTAYESGVTFFDTAEMYGDGRSEQLVAKALSDVRDRIVIASKVSPAHFPPNELRAALERTLRNLQTDWVDLYQLHWPNRDIPVADTLDLLEDLKAEGKIRSYGVSNYGPKDLAECLATGRPIATNQLAYNLLFRAIEYEILPLCRDNGMGVLCYCSLMQGLLTGKFASAGDVPDDRARTRHFSRSRPLVRHEEAGQEAETFSAIAQVRQIADELGAPMADVALAWLLAQDGITAVIAGARNAQQARDNVRGADLALSSDVVRRLSQATDPLKQKLGPNTDMWQSKSRIR